MGGIGLALSWNSGMNPNLFVYGTLLSGAGHPKGAQLAREARLLGAATIRGCRLFSLGRYPGLVEAAAADGLVHGEVFALNRPAASLEWLDAYEGIAPGSAENQYERTERDVQLAAGETVKAWVYLYRKAVPAQGAIASGRWLAP
jgi:gamma-glutamylcyclotransferase (GGCT)/AIG2-like uncharacterized protein YtfP